MSTARITHCEAVKVPAIKGIPHDFLSAVNEQPRPRAEKRANFYATPVR